MLVNSEYLIQALNENEAAHPREERSMWAGRLGASIVISSPAVPIKT